MLAVLMLKKSTSEFRIPFNFEVLNKGMFTSDAKEVRFMHRLLLWCYFL